MILKLLSFGELLDPVLSEEELAGVMVTQVASGLTAEQVLSKHVPVFIQGHWLIRDPILTKSGLLPLSDVSLSESTAEHAKGRNHRLTGTIDGEEACSSLCSCPNL